MGGTGGGGSLVFEAVNMAAADAAEVLLSEEGVMMIYLSRAAIYDEWLRGRGEEYSVWHIFLR